jgi:hypothetical protein
MVRTITRVKTTVVSAVLIHIAGLPSDRICTMESTDAKMETFTEILEAGTEKGWLGYSRLLESNVRMSTEL